MNELIITLPWITLSMLLAIRVDSLTGIVLQTMSVIAIIMWQTEHIKNN